MKRKLRRGRRSVFGKRGMPPALKTLLWILVCVTVVAAGYFGAMWASEGSLPQLDLPSANTDKPSASPEKPSGNGGSGNDQVVTPNTPVTPPSSADEIRAFYLPHSALTADNLPTTLTAAYNAGFNAVLFDLKDADGNLYYRFTNAQAKKVGSYTEDAFTSDGLDALFDTINECGLMPIPRLYAFCDNAAASVLTDARIGLESNHSWAWYDGDRNDGGKKWLNPYSEAAHTYIGALATELADKGAVAIMLDGVQFPLYLNSSYLGEEAATVTKDAALTAFVEKMRTQLGSDCSLLLGCSEKGALGTDTKIYGGNPLTFGADFAVPVLSSKIQGSIEKMILRTQVLTEKPTLAPMLKTIGLTAEQVSDAIAACIKGGAKDFILFDHEGYYEFSAYTLP